MIKYKNFYKKIDKNSRRKLYRQQNETPAVYLYLFLAQKTLVLSKTLYVTLPVMLNSIRYSKIFGLLF